MYKSTCGFGCFAVIPEISSKMENVPLSTLDS